MFDSTKRPLLVRLAALIVLSTFLFPPMSAFGQATPSACAPTQAATPAANPEPLPAIPTVQVPDGATQVTMGYTPASIFAPVFVAREKGYFAEQGLDVDLQPLAGGADMIVLTATGEFDVSIAGTGPAFWNG
ncbi:MAG: ABC transporter substrate-binding protein, partial [Chloroflexota bacterium]|nr:ABC transporter substrate-binding protein [Chloroflexota bacterium]